MSFGGETFCARVGYPYLEGAQPLLTEPSSMVRHSLLTSRPAIRATLHVTRLGVVGNQYSADYTERRMIHWRIAVYGRRIRACRRDT